MSKKLDVIKDAVFHAQSNPKALADLISALVTDVATQVVVNGVTTIENDVDGVSMTVSGEVFSQYGDLMNSEITFALKAPVVGVSIADDTVTIADTVIDGTTFIVTGTVGGVVGELLVTVTVAE